MDPPSNVGFQCLLWGRNQIFLCIMQFNYRLRRSEILNHLARTDPAEPLKYLPHTVIPRLAIFSLSELYIPAPCRCRGYCYIWSHSRTHSDTPQSVGLLWTSDRPVTDTSTWHQTTFTRDTSMTATEIETAIPASERPQTHALHRAAQRLVTCGDVIRNLLFFCFKGC